jgi:hypothetical protein
MLILGLETYITGFFTWIYRGVGVFRRCYQEWKWQMLLENGSPPMRSRGETLVGGPWDFPPEAVDN